MFSFRRPLGCLGEQLSRRLYSRRTPSVAELLRVEKDGKREGLEVHGYVRSSRKYKTEQFVDVSDGSSLKPLQAVMPRTLGTDIRVGSAVRLAGDLVPCENQQQQTHELKVSGVEIVGACDPKTCPIQKKYQSLEYLRTLPHLRPRIPLNSAQLRLRSSTISAISTHFTTTGFTQTHPPLITSSDCEGAGEVFTITSGTPTEQARPKTKPTDHFFRSPKYLTVSTQLHLEALAQAIGPVWTLSPTFRAEQSDTSRHMSEFYMLEAEVPFVSSLNSIMDILENLLRSTTSTLRNTPAARDLLAAVATLRTEEPDLASPEDLAARWSGMSSEAPAWPRVPYSEAVDILQAAEKETPGLFDTRAPVWGEGLASEHEKWLAVMVSESRNPGWRTPVFVTHYPRAMKAFYMLPTANFPNDRETVDCFDLLVPEVCELSGGSMREFRLEPLLETMESRGMALPTGKDIGRSTAGLDWYVDLRRWGSPPHGGFGVGFDRLLSYLSGVPNVKDVVAFPRWHGRCDC